jgi:hypothetical protein
MRNPRLMAVLAHPDDESLGVAFRTKRSNASIPGANSRRAKERFARRTVSRLPASPHDHVLANRRLPKNNSNILIAGQTWMQFSFNIPWSDGDNIMRLGTGLSNDPNLLKQIFLSKEVLRC